ncbi:adenine nucleotide alpha hydrolases-like protein [Aspergillus sclerotioniger CBS 115572]|uniref:Adenine nucleotide alpha hydrolases-like protein n=1 Tax=Aspergillus sclerotioniger CBS 115572 TaxID=1450535 RepID=A0A317VA75_9EURO|nr:adenine nucleotide alpha hydrolases-like protein [Aspergillus sclerotioniger CBS 115572]PWY71126.1 adenine nucleotide alpha hydrolases-like protein [Aspergillus sclerotioniger CBS 115572]
MSSTSAKPSLEGRAPVPGRTRTGSIPTRPSRGDSRRKSIQFNIGGSESQPPSRSASVSGRKRSPSHVYEKEAKAAGRGLSPPPPKTYERGVSFDTFDNPDAPDFSLTLNYKHKGYQSTRRSRTFLCGTDQNDYSDFALEWLIDELVDDGDEIVCLRAVEKDSSIASDAAVEAGKYRKEAEKLLEQVIQKNSQNEKAISLVLELAVGKIQDIIQRMIRIYEPAVLIVGTRGRNLGGVQGLLPGSVSKYCLQQSPIPVIVVRPSTKREKKKKKRLADPTRRNYNHILEMSERRGSDIFDRSSSRDSSVSKLPDEEAAVAAALGLPQTYTNSRSSLSTSERSSVSHDESPSPMGSPGPVSRSPLGGSVENSEVDTGSDDEPTVSHVEDHEDVSPKQEPSEPSNHIFFETQNVPGLTEGVAGAPSSNVTVPLIVTEDISPDGSEKQSD